MDHDDKPTLAEGLSNAIAFVGLAALVLVLAAIILAMFHQPIGADCHAAGT